MNNQSLVVLLKQIVVGLTAIVSLLGAHAAPVDQIAGMGGTPNYWVYNYASSTLTPVFGSSTAISVGSCTGCSGGAIPTSTLTYSAQITATTTVNTVISTTTATTVWNYTLPTSTLGTLGQELRITAQGNYYNNSGNNQSWSVSLGYGSSTMTMQPSNLNSANNIGDWQATWYLTNASGTANNQLVAGNALVQANGTTNTKGGGAVWTISSTSSQQLYIQLTNGVASTTMYSSINSVQVMLDGATTTIAY